MWRPKAGSRALDTMRATRASREKRRGRWLERDDARRRVDLLQGIRHTHQHTRRSYRADECVDAADLLDQFAADASIAIQCVGIVELIGPKGVRVPCQFGDSGLEAIEQCRRNLTSIARHDLEVGTKGPHCVEFLDRESVR